MAPHTSEQESRSSTTGQDLRALEASHGSDSAAEVRASRWWRRLLPYGLVWLCGLTALTCHRKVDSGDFPRAQALYVGGPQWGEPSSFNPLASSPDWPVKAYFELMYETLFIYDALRGTLEPHLAEAYEVFPDRVELTLRTNARWSDGRLVTAEDVKYSFDLGEQFPGTPVAPLWSYITEVRIIDPEVKQPRRLALQLTAKRPNPLTVLDMFQELRIIPKHVFEPAIAAVGGDFNELLKQKFDRQPVISGPYQLHSYSGEKIVTERRDDYWGNEVFFGGRLAGPKYLIHPIYKANDHYSVALQQGRLDASTSFIPRIWLKRRKGVRTWYDEPPYFVPTSMPTLLLNHTVPTLQDVRLRRAMALSINYRDIQELAVSGYSEPMRSGLVLPFGPEAKYYAEEDHLRYGATVYAPDRAKQLLLDAGYQPIFGKDGELLETRSPEGVRIPTLYIKSATGWTDWEAIVRIAVRGMRQAGIDVRERFVDGALFWNATVTGDFDLIMNTPASPPSPSKPWSRFEAVLTSHGWKPIGQNMYKNQGRFNQPQSDGYVARFDQLLAQIPTLTSDEALIAAYRELNRLFMQYQPAIPVVYRPHNFYSYSEKHWRGFATSRNPFLPPAIPSDALGTRALWHLRSVEDK